jgi:hypothetical protein
MSVKQAGSGRSRWKTTVCAGLWLGTLVAGPALAANYLENDCDRVNEAAPAGEPEDLKAVVVAGYDLDRHRDAEALSELQSDTTESVRFVPGQGSEKPLIRLDETPSALAESSVDTTDLAPNLQSEQQETEGLDTRIPGISDDELQRFKRQMYRKDI